MIKIGINGFGRIGRFVFRSTVEAENAWSRRRNCASGR